MGIAGQACQGVVRRCWAGGRPGGGDQLGFQDGPPAVLHGGVGQIAQVGRQPEPIPHRQGWRGLQVAAQSENGAAGVAWVGAAGGLAWRRAGGVWPPPGKRLRHKAPGAPQQGRSPIDQLQQGIIEGAGDRQVVHQEGIGEAGQPLQRLRRGDAERLAAPVAAGGHQGAAHRLRQQLVQTRGRQHHAQGGAAGGDRFPGAVAVGEAAPQQHDRRGGVAQGPLLGGRHLHHSLQLAGIEQEQGEGFARTLFALPQARHRLALAGVHQQLEAPHALQGQDAPLDQQVAGGCQGVVALRQATAPRIPQRQPGAAGRATDRFGVKAAIGRIAELPRAARTGGKGGEGGVGAAEGQGGGQAVAGSAGAAADEGVAVAAGGGVRQLRQAAGAGRPVGAEARRLQP